MGSASASPSPQAGGAAAAAKPAPSAARARRASSEPPEPARRKPTVAQTQEVQRILRLGENKLYEKLNVEQNADEADIKRAYKKLSLKLHPDRNPHPQAEAAFQAVNKANEVRDHTGLSMDILTCKKKECGVGGWVRVRCVCVCACAWVRRAKALTWHSHGRHLNNAPPTTL